MRLEDVVEMYGMNDYLDMQTGYIYELSKAYPDGEGGTVVPVRSDGTLIGTTTIHI